MVDPYLSVSIETLGIERTIIALQHYAANSFRNYETCKRLDDMWRAVHWQHAAAWANKNARILMGVE